VQNRRRLLLKGERRFGSGDLVRKGEEKGKTKSIDPSKITGYNYVRKNREKGEESPGKGWSRLGLLVLEKNEEKREKKKKSSTALF